jgi:hypothetical protein
LALPLQGPPSYHQGQQNSPILVNSCRGNTVHGIKDITGLLKSKVVARDETCWAILKSKCNQHKMEARAWLDTNEEGSLAPWTFSGDAILTAGRDWGCRHLAAKLDAACK